MREIALAEIQDQLPEYLHIAEQEEVVITQSGRPVGILIGFESEEDWFDYVLEHEPRFLARIESARQSLCEGKGVLLENLE